MKQMLKEAWIILMITLFAGVALGFVYQITKEPIAEQKKMTEQKACAAVFRDADSFEVMDVGKGLDYPDGDLEKLYVAKDPDGGKMGYVMVITAHNGYGGDITFTLGIRVDGTTNGISITQIGETAGLGMNAEKVLVPQFENKAVDSFSIVKQEAVYDNQIQAISGATITTTAITEAVNAGLDYYYNNLGGVRHE